MKLSKLKAIFIIGLFVSLAATGTLAEERPFPSPKGNPGMASMPTAGSGLHGLMPFLKLGLSEAQQKELLGIINRYNNLRRTYMESMMSSGWDMAAVLEADEPDEESARNIFKRQSSIREDLFILDRKMMSEIKKVLTTEQLELIKGPMAGRPERPFGPPDELMGSQEE